MADFNAQNTDAENSKPLVTSVPADDDVSQISSKSAQAIAQDRANQNTASGSGGDPVGANVQAGK